MNLGQQVILLSYNDGVGDATLAMAVEAAIVAGVRNDTAGLAPKRAGSPTVQIDGILEAE